jgi:hypothetical protein
LVCGRGCVRTISYADTPKKHGRWTLSPAVFVSELSWRTRLPTVATAIR